MKKELIVTGHTIEQALESACAQLGIERGRDDYEQEIIETPSKGFLGLGSRPAKVRVSIEVPDEPAAAPAPKAAPAPAAKPEPAPAPAPKAEPKPAPAPKAEPAPAPAPEAEPAPAPKAESAPKSEKPEKPVNFGNKPAIVESYLRDIIGAMGLADEGVEVVVTTDGQTIRAQINNDANGATIGRRGETLDALQYLASLAANHGSGDYVRISVDSGSYRDKRRRTLEALAKRLANNSVRTGRSNRLEPMNPYERRIIHAAVAEVEGATSASTGEEPNRYVVISSTNPRPERGEGRPPRGGHSRGDRDNRSRGDRGGRGGRGDRGPRRPKSEPYHESGTREVAPAEAQNHSLYGKVEI